MTDLVKASEASVSAETMLYVIFRVADSEYILPSDTVVQMETFSGATPVPGAPPFVSGIVQLRGKVVPVVDLRLRFGHPGAPLTIDSRVLVGQRGDRTVGLLVDSAREVVRLQASELKPPPPILDYEASGFVKAVAQLGPRLVMLVDFAKVIGEEQMDGVE